MNEAELLERIPEEAELFSRWKYAEEAAGRLLAQGHLVRIEVEPDVKHVEGDEEYVYDEFIVYDLGHRP